MKTWLLKIVGLAMCGSLSLLVAQARAEGDGVVPDKPNLVVFSVEVDPYLISKGEKDTDVQEARQMARLFKRRGSDLFAKVETKVLVGKGANRKHVLDGLRWICKNTSANDVGVIFISAHGGSDDGKFGIALAGEEALSGSEMRQELAKAKGKILFMLESCGSGALLTEKSRKEKFPTCVIICASRAEESADTGFGYSILDGLAGKADLDGDGTVTAHELEKYLRMTYVKDDKGATHIVVSHPKSVDELPLVTTGK